MSLSFKPTTRFPLKENQSSLYHANSIQENICRQPCYQLLDLELE